MECVWWRGRERGGKGARVWEESEERERAGGGGGKGRVGRMRRSASLLSVAKTAIRSLCGDS